MNASLVLLGLVIAWTYGTVDEKQGNENLPLAGLH